LPSCRNMPALAHNLAASRPVISTWSSSARPARRPWRPRSRSRNVPRARSGRKIVYAENSFHGKTKGVLSITDGPLYRGEFKLVDNTVRRFRSAISRRSRPHSARPGNRRHRARDHPGRRRHHPGAAAYWQKLRALCDQYGVLWVADEVQCGFGRSGRFYAFEHAAWCPM
jgi:ornithine--oxo-acid transaminase